MCSDFLGNIVICNEHYLWVVFCMGDCHFLNRSVTHQRWCPDLGRQSADPVPASTGSHDPHVLKQRIELRHCYR